jgi:hypothetical protein
MEERIDPGEADFVRNPFRHVNRDNFPGLDQALALGEEHDAKISAQQQPDRHRQQQEGSFYYDDRISPDHSICSLQTSSSFPTSSLNMSIGARAALNEHLRHVALHGIDGHQSPPSEASQCSFDRLESQGSFDRLPQDELWDRLMDGNVSIISASFPSLFDRLQPVVSISEDGEEAVEVLEMDSSGSDFFDSSKVWQLSTPEKAKGIRRSITTRRGDEQYEESDSGSQESGMMYLYNAALGMHEAGGTSTSVDHNNTSFLSLGVDLSRISNSDISAPDAVSFHQRNMFTDDFMPDVATPSRSPSRRVRDQSFSTPSRLGSLLSPEHPSMFSPSRQSVSTIRGGGERDNPLAVDIGLSPIAAQAGSIAVKLGRPSRRHHPGEAFPAFSPTSSCHASPNVLVDRMQNLRMDQSPISQANSGFDMRIFPMTVSENCILDMDDNKRDRSKSSASGSAAIGLKPRESSPKTSSSLSTISPHPSDSPNKQQSSSETTSEDRRRYRTVVPARVFMDEPNDFPFQDDSFCSSHSATVDSTSDSDDESPLPSRSLLVSFDEASDEFEVALNDS